MAKHFRCFGTIQQYKECRLTTVKLQLQLKKLVPMTSCEATSSVDIQSSKEFSGGKGAQVKMLTPEERHLYLIVRHNLKYMNAWEAIKLYVYIYIYIYMSVYM